MSQIPSQTIHLEASDPSQIATGYPPEQTIDLGLMDAQGASSGYQELRYWRSLEQWENTPEFQEFLHREFQEGAAEAPEEGVSRRNFLGIVAASVALGGMTVKIETS